jgi:K+-transporting ATPase c subunit
MSLSQVQQLIDANTTPGELGFLGADRVNVTTLNVALAASSH